MYPDQLSHSVASELGLHCLPLMHISRTCSNFRTNIVRVELIFSVKYGLLETTQGTHRSADTDMKTVCSVFYTLPHDSGGAL